MNRPVLITGASGSVGSVAVKAMAKAGYPVIMACRNLDKADKVRSSVLSEIPSADISIRKLNLNSLSDVSSFAAGMLSENLKLGALFNNAGTLNRDYKLTVDGYEETFAVNYLAPYLLTRKLLPLMDNTSRIVNMVSLTAGLSRIDRNCFSEGPEKYSQLGTYGRTKLCLLLFTIALSHHCDCIVNMSDPGVVNSNMISMGRWFDPIADVLFRPFCKSPESGAAPAVRALMTDSRLRYFVGDKAKPVAERFLNHKDLEWLWEETERRLFL